MKNITINSFLPFILSCFFYISINAQSLDLKRVIASGGGGLNGYDPELSYCLNLAAELNENTTGGTVRLIYPCQDWNSDGLTLTFGNTFEGRMIIEKINIFNHPSQENYTYTLNERILPGGTLDYTTMFGTSFGNEAGGEPVVLYLDVIGELYINGCSYTVIGEFSIKFELCGDPEINMVSSEQPRLSIEVEDSGKDIRVSPNPAQNEISIRYSLGKSTAVQIELYNTLGQKIKTVLDSQQEEGEYTLSENLEDGMESGLYYLRCIFDDKIHTQTILKH